MTTLNVLVIGDKDVGKSTFIRRHVTGEFKSNAVEWETTNGTIKFKLIEENSETGNDYGVDAVIIMFSLTSKKSYLNVLNWYNYVVKMYTANIPILVVGNKRDLNVNKMNRINIIIHKQLNIPYFEISMFTCYNFEKPFLSILKAYTGENVKLIALDD